MNKSALRHHFREARRQLTAQQQRAASMQFKVQFEQSRYAKHQTIALYLAQDGELDLFPLIASLWALNKRCLLPVLRPGGSLVFAEYTPGTRLKANRFGIKEPYAAAICAIQNIDLVLVPLVAFDDKGGRIGMGAGCYDRTFVNHQSLLLGVAHSVQQAMTPLPVDDWDIPLHAVMTESLLVEVASCS